MSCQALAGSLCGLAQRRLKFGEGLLDRVEVGAVGRQIDELCALRSDGFGDGSDCRAGRGDPMDPQTATGGAFSAPTQV